MRRSTDFGAAVRTGRRAGSKLLVVHVLHGDEHTLTDREPVVGFVVSKSVGGAVVRNRVKRRLRALMRPLIPRLPPGARVVVRANPDAADASTAALYRDLVAALRRAGDLPRRESPS
jgi:ribonuclease P protein component